MGHTPGREEIVSDNVFHKHLDKCEHCDRNPFDLCPEGAAALKEAAGEAMEKLPKWAL